MSNCHTLARRRLRAQSADAEWWQHVLRICEKAGATSRGVLRAAVPTEITEGSEAAPVTGETLIALARGFEEYGSPWSKKAARELRHVAEHLDALERRHQQAINWRECHLADERLAHQETRGTVAALKQEIDALIRSQRADEGRLRAAEARVWDGVTWGCDAPDHMAEEILSLRAQLHDERKKNDQRSRGSPKYPEAATEAS